MESHGQECGENGLQSLQQTNNETYDELMLVMGGGESLKETDRELASQPETSDKSHGQKQQQS